MSRTVSTLVRLGLAGALFVHGLAHWQITSLWGTRPGPESWLFGAVAPVFGEGSWIAVLIAYLAGAVLLAGRARAWRPLAGTASLLSAAIIVLFWDPAMVIGLVIDLVVVGVLVVPAASHRLDAVARLVSAGGAA